MENLDTPAPSDGEPLDGEDDTGALGVYAYCSLCLPERLHNPQGRRLAIYGETSDDVVLKALCLDDGFGAWLAETMDYPYDAKFINAGKWNLDDEQRMWLEVDGTVSAEASADVFAHAIREGAEDDLSDGEIKSMLQTLHAAVLRFAAARHVKLGVGSHECKGGKQSPGRRMSRPRPEAPARVRPRPQHVTLERKRPKRAGDKAKALADAARIARSMADLLDTGAGHVADGFETDISRDAVAALKILPTVALYLVAQGERAESRRESGLRLRGLDVDKEPASWTELLQLWNHKLFGPEESDFFDRCAQSGDDAWWAIASPGGWTRAFSERPMAMERTASALLHAKSDEERAALWLHAACWQLRAACHDASLPSPPAVDAIQRMLRKSPITQPIYWHRTKETLPVWTETIPLPVEALGSPTVLVSWTLALRLAIFATFRIVTARGFRNEPG